MIELAWWQLAIMLIATFCFGGGTSLKISAWASGEINGWELATEQIVAGFIFVVALLGVIIAFVSAALGNT